MHHGCRVGVEASPAELRIENCNDPAVRSEDRPRKFLEAAVWHAMFVESQYFQEIGFDFVHRNLLKAFAEAG